MNIFMRIGCSALLMAVSILGYAEDRVVAIWDCELNEGKTMADVQAANGKWVKLVNREAGGDIRSFAARPTIGGGMNGFKYLDSFPSLDAWVAAQKAMQSDEGQAIDAGLNAAASCESSALYDAEESG